jgi:DNA-binding NtrC family response regulator
MAKVLIVDDEVAILVVLERVLKTHDYEVVSASNPDDAIHMLSTDQIDLLLTDLRLNASLNGFELMTEARKISPSLPVIVITAYGTVDVAVKAIRDGADDFVCKPFSLDDLIEKIQRVLGGRERKREGSGDRLHFGTLVGESQVMQDVYRLIEKAGASDLPVLIQGASGTGKELVAGAVHRLSSRALSPWKAMNCAAVSPLLLESEMFGHLEGAFTGADAGHEGMFPAADGGTLFLDEVATIPLDLQAKLLRVLENGEVRPVGGIESKPIDVRLISATSSMLDELVEQNIFRKDLLFRLKVIDIYLPPLKERGDDWVLLLEHFRQVQERRLRKPVTFAEEVWDVLAAYDWPGNVRELANAVACGALLSEDEPISLEALPPSLISRSEEIFSRKMISHHSRSGASLEDYLKHVESEYVDRIIKKVKKNYSEAAKLLGISRATFYRKYVDK